MGTPLRLPRGGLLATLASWVCAATVAAADSAALSVCVEQDNPPFSSQDGNGGAQGIDIDVAQALAQRLQRSLRIVWVTEPERGGFGKALRQSIDAGKCDAFMGVPASRDSNELLREHALAVSVPYLIVGYVYASRTGSVPATPQDARRAKRIGVTSATPGDLYLHAHNLNRVPYPSTAAVLQALAAGEADLGLVWTPAVASAAQTSHGNWVLSREPADDPALRTPLAVAVRAADSSLRRDIDTALRTMHEESAIARIAADRGLFHLQP